MAVDANNTTLRVTSPHSDVHNLDAVTMMAWVNFDTTAAYGGVLGINYITLVSQKLLGLYYAAPSSYLMLSVDYTGTSSVSLAFSPSTGSWHHICGAWSDALDSGRSHVFVDGSDETIPIYVPTGTPSPDGGPIFAASALYPVHYRMDGKLADAAIFDRRLEDDEIAAVAAGRLRANHFDPVWHVTFEGEDVVAGVGDIGLRDTTGRGSHIDLITNAPDYVRDPPLHWPVGAALTPYTDRVTRNSRPTMNVVPGSKLATMRRAF